MAESRLSGLQLKEENKITVSRSLAVDKHSIKLGTLIAALFYDLSLGKKTRVPSRAEDRERELQELVRKSKRPVALFIDDAHALKDEALTGLKRLMERLWSQGTGSELRRQVGRNQGAVRDRDC